ncbi:hypothetical protein C0991_006641 [Blastosporella zonata]|nr:hypothetical protein C0991_006641 [Blastosporella zonata]
MKESVVSLPSATSTEHLEALAEVSNFGRTDMGYTGEGPWTYRILSAESLDQELTRMSRAKSYRFGVDVVSLQPCLSYASRSQDRYIIEEWDLPDGKWIFSAVMDGHVNHDTVDFVAQTLPTTIKDALRNSASGQLFLQVDYISKILGAAIQEIDDRITSRFMDLLHRSPDDINSGPDFDKVLSTLQNLDYRRSLGGVTLVLGVTDSRGNLWVVNLGDCRAVLGNRHGKTSSGSQVNTIHDLNNPEELSRVTRDHPAEPNAIKDGRVIGFLEPTRAMGDTWLKVSTTYASRVYMSVKQPWISSKQFEQYTQRIITPPYVSNVPEVYHFVPEAPYFLLLGSDGLLSTDRYNGMDATKVVEHWVSILGNALDFHSTNSTPNAALCVLRDVLGGDDIDTVSRNLTVEMEERWMDDTTILVQKVWTAYV